MRDFSRTVLRNSTFGLAAQLAIKVLSTGFSVFIVRHLGVEAFGQYAAVSAFGAVFIFMADLGLSAYTVRALARQRDLADGRERAAALFADVLTLRLLLSLVAAVMLISTAWLTGRPLVMVGAIALNAITLLIYGVQGTAESMLAGFERLDLNAGTKVLYQFTFVVLGALALLIGLGYYGLILANMVAVGLMAATCWRAVRLLGLRPGRRSPGAWRGLLRASLPFGFIGFALGLSYRFDTVLLSIFRGDTETGYYSAAYSLVFTTIVISNIINTALYPSLTREVTRAPQLLPQISERALRYLLMISLPIAVGAWATAEQFVPTLFGEAYRPAIRAMQIVIWVVPFMYASEFLGYLVVIADREARVARSVMVSTAVNVLLNLLLVPRFGLLAAAVMTVVTEVILVSQHAWTLRQTLRQMHWGSTLGRPLAAALSMGGVVLVLAPYLPWLANVAIGAATYGGLLLVLGALGKDELLFVRGILRQRAPHRPRCQRLRSCWRSTTFCRVIQAALSARRIARPPRCRPAATRCAYCAWSTWTSGHAPGWLGRTTSMAASRCGASPSIRQRRPIPSSGNTTTPG